MKTYETIHEAYLASLLDVFYNPDYECAPRGLAIREKLDFQFRIMHPEATPIITHDAERNAVIADYTKKEWDLYDSCSNKVEDFAKASKFWNKIANPDGTINSAYGYLIWKNRSVGSTKVTVNPTSGAVSTTDELITPWEWAKQSLIKDKDTRQAFVRFSLPQHQYFSNKDQVCTMHAVFSIRDDKLNLSVVMRSNDLVLGLAYDLPWFISLIDRMVAELKPTYPSLEKGMYTHLAHSMHIYMKDEEKVLKMLGHKS